MFPITYCRQFNYTVQGDEHWIASMLRTRIAAALTKKGAQKVTIEDQQVQFGGGFSSPRFSRFPLHDISKGNVAVTCRNNQLNLTLKLNFAGFVIFVFVELLFVLGIFVLIAGSSNVFTPRAISDLIYTQNRLHLDA
jgi:hypothetical protein